MRKQVERALAQVEKQLGAFTSKRKLLVGVSGGPDSLALLHVLRQSLTPDRLAAAHLNHHLRPSADAEARFVQDTAAGWGIVYRGRDEDVSALAAERGLSVEEAGRLARYRFFAEVAAEIGAGAVAVGHHADDQVETVLMHILRGSGLAGLRGMQPISPLPGAPEIALVRPLLGVDRAGIEAYCREHGLQPVEDLSNQDTGYFRNRLRHELIPALETYNPQIRERLRDLATLTAADVALLEKLAGDSWTEVVVHESNDSVVLDLARWRQAPLSIRRTLLRRAIQALGRSLADVSFATLEQARSLADRGETGAKSSLPGGLVMAVEYERLIISAEPTAVPRDMPQLPTEEPVSLPVPGKIRLANQWTIEAAIADAMTPSQVKNNQDPWQAFVDTHGQALQVRPRRSGERFQPLGMGGKSASIKEAMINRKIAAPLRRLWPLVASEDHLVWMVGHQIDERARVTAPGKNIVWLRCRPLEDVSK